MYKSGFNIYDESIVEELKYFIPDKIFDAHAHLYRLQDLNLKGESILSNGPAQAGIDIWRKAIGNITGNNRITGGLFFPYPAADGHINAENSFIIEQLKKAPDSRGLVLISPDAGPGETENFLKNKSIAGFKVYYSLIKDKPSFQAELIEYAPEWLWELSDKYGAVIMVHLMKTAALSDRENLRQIIEMCSKYPSVKLILAHGARGFHSYNTKKGIASLRGLKNVWFDTSGLCEPGAIKAVISEFGPQKLMWGTDFPISQVRGKCITMGDGFAWIQSESTDWKLLTETCNPTLIGIENIRALRDAAEDFGLNHAEIEDIFFNNAIKLLGINN